MYFIKIMDVIKREIELNTNCHVLQSSTDLTDETFQFWVTLVSKCGNHEFMLEWEESAEKLAEMEDVAAVKKIATELVAEYLLAFKEVSTIH